MEDQSFQDTVSILKFLYPYTKLATRIIQQGTGYVNLSSPYAALLTKDGLSPWARFYENPKWIKSLTTAAILGSKDFKTFKEAFQDISERNAKRYQKLLMRVVAKHAKDGSLAAQFEYSPPVSQNAIDRWYRGLAASKKSEYQADLYLFLYALIVNSFNFISLMTFGASLSDLVARAKSGDDDAFFQAVQIDKTTLFGITYFQQRVARASITNDVQFFYKLGIRVQSPPIAGKIKHKRLMLVFAMLDDEGLLNRPLSEIFDACEAIGAYGQRHQIYDDDSLRKRLSEYLSRTGRQIRI